MTLNEVIGAVTSYQAGNENPDEVFDWKDLAPEDTIAAFELLSEKEKDEFEALLAEAAEKSRELHDDCSNEQETMEDCEQNLEAYHGYLYDTFSRFIFEE
jgi:hypothetical protein